MPEVLTTLTPSKPRRIFGAGLLSILGVLLIYISLTQPSEIFVYRIGLPVLGGFFLWRAWRSWQITEQRLELRRDGLFDLDGTMICAFDNIASVDRGLFAFKPSNGFLIRMHEPMSRGWMPGLWWRFGRRLGVGGSTPPGEGKQMADIISVLLSEKTP